jgi:uncharacterized protein involved in exopolysaccharide biosynthesis
MDSRNQLLVAQDGLTIREYLDFLWRTRWKIGAFVAACTLATAVTVLLLPKEYRASILVSAVTGQSGSGQLGGLSSLLSQFGGGLSSLAGLSLSSDSKRAESVAVLQSDALTERYIEQNNLLPVLYKKDWDAATGRWKQTDPLKMPTLWKANERFKKSIRKVVLEPHSGLVTLAITWTDPKVAAKWANDLVKLTNDYLRRKAIDEADRNIAYLTEQAAKTDVVGIKQAIYSLLQSEINKEMLARGTDEYAFKVLDPAIAPERASFPMRTLSVIVAFIASTAAAMLALFVRLAWLR